jgi:hypothetical protein
LLKRKRAESNVNLNSDRADLNIVRNTGNKKLRELGNGSDVKTQKTSVTNNAEKAGYCHQCNVKREPDGMLLAAVILSGQLSAYKLSCSVHTKDQNRLGARRNIAGAVSIIDITKTLLI